MFDGRHEYLMCKAKRMKCIQVACAQWIKRKENWNQKDRMSTTVNTGHGR